MKCDEFEIRLNEVLDRRERPERDASLCAHGDSCPPCRALAASYGSLLDGVHALTTPAPPVDLAARVLDACQARPSTAAPASWLAAALTTAAAVALAAWPLLRGPQPAPVIAAPTGQLAQATPQAAAPPPPAANPTPNWEEVNARFNSLPVVGPMLTSLRAGEGQSDPYAALARSTGQGLAAVVLVMPRFGGTPGMISIAPPGAESLPGWPAGVSDGFKPVTDSVTETIDLLLQAVRLGSKAS